MVLAVGNPFGLSHTVTFGIVSAKGRADVGIVDYEDFIQTDAAINEGNSGGALIDAEGKLLGINAATFSRSREFTGIGLATPADLAMSVARDLAKYGKVIRGWVGLEVQTIFMTGSDAPSLLVTGTHPQGPAARSGVREGDIITHIDREPVGDGQATMHQIAMLRPGEDVALSLLRDSVEMDIRVTVAAKPQVATADS
jgi:serine protease DegS